MFHLVHSNRAERLLERLLCACGRGSGDPFAPETIVVQNQGMARWLSQQIALRSGIAANLQFPLPATFVWRIFEAWFGKQPAAGAFEREALRWRCMATLPGLLDDPAFAEVAGYLRGERGRRELYNLCGRLADVFDQYLVYRPDWIFAWEEGVEDHWQARLWRAISAGQAGEHRARLLMDLRQAAASGAEPLGELPQRIHLFGLTSLAPTYLEVLTSIADRCEVHVYLLNPSREYWADIADERSQARRRARWRRQGEDDISNLLDLGNPLLASLGHAGQEFLDQLLELNPLDEDAFEPAGRGDLLAHLQDDILELHDARVAADAAKIELDAVDDSLVVHSCHSALREIQVLHDRLLDWFDRHPDLAPRDVIVMAPDIDQYAPYIDAVFGAADNHIPWSIADRRIGADQPLLDALNELLRLPLERVTASWMLSLLEIPPVAARFALDQTGLDRLRTWVAESGIRWGLDAADRSAAGLPLENAHSWDFGLARLFLGYAMPTDTDLFGGVAPYADVEGGEAVFLGALQDFLQRVELWRGRLKKPCGPAEWQTRINRLLEDFLLPDGDEEDAAQQVRLVMDGLRTQAEAAGFGAELELDTIRSHLQLQLQETTGARRFLTGRVTFCNMVPMRGIPFRVVCLLGMNDGQFPRVQHPLGFDLIARQPRRGDRSRRRDDRYLFLEALLSARQTLYISYQGRNIRDNSPRQPSVVVEELLDYAGRAYRMAGVEFLARHLCTDHPLQPFSPRYFDGRSGRLFSYASEWLSAANSRAGEIPVFAPEPLARPARESPEVDIGELLSFFRSPAAWFLHHRLGLRLPGEEDALQDEEPFTLDGLQRYRLVDFTVEGLLRDQSAEALQARWKAVGELPHGLVGEVLMARNVDGLDEFADRIRAAMGEPLDPVELALPVGNYMLSGRLDNVTSNGLLGWRGGKLRPQDRLAMWIQHVVLNTLYPVVSRFLAIDAALEFTPIENAQTRLTDLLDLWQEGQERPLPFFPRTSWAYAQKGEMTSTVFTTWHGNSFSNLQGERDEPAARIVYRDSDPLEDEFQQLALRLYGPMMEATEDPKKGKRK